MKKTIIAMAALAVSGATFAQVTITGTLATGYKATKATSLNAFTLPAGLGGATLSVYSAGGDSAGMGIDTSEINFTAKEDLGGGQTIEAKLGLAGADRSGESTAASGNGAVTGRDAIMTYTNQSFGRIQLGTTRAAAVHAGIPTADAPVIDMDGKLFQQRSNSDFVSYAVPIGPVFFELKQSESSAGIGLGQGSAGVAGTKVGQRTTDYAVAYLSGPLKVVGAYRTYDNRNKNTIATAEGLTKDQVYAFQLGYDVGVAKFGFGYNVTTASVGPKVQDMLLGVSVPLGSLTLGASYGMAITSGVADAAVSAFPAPAALPSQAAWKSIMQQADGTATGFSIGGRYDLSKRTNVLVRYASWTRSGYEQFEAFGATNQVGEFGYGDRASETSILLVHNF